MNYISVADAAKKWGVSERSVRNYCAEGRVKGQGSDVCRKGGEADFHQARPASDS